MQKYTIYHNPLCSKSRATLDILKSHGIEPIIIEYIKKPLNIEQLKSLRVHFSLKDFIRTNDAVFKDLGLSLEDENSLLRAMTIEPKLMQRPIVTYKNRAIIGRPPENVLSLLADQLL